MDMYMVRPGKRCSNHQRLRRKVWEEIQWCELFGGSDGKASVCNAGDLGLIPVLGRSPEEGNGYPLQWIHGVAKSWTWLSHFHLHLFNFYSQYIMWNAGLDKAQAGIKIARRNINNLRYADDTTLMAESKEELMSLLMKVKEEWKSWLKTQHSEN